jgi:SulP family sulfate permease
MAPTQATRNMPSRLRRWARAVPRYIPLVASLRDYRREWLSGDVTAGLVVAVMLVPQGMAYALLAGLPPQVGLYASIFPIMLYAAFGSSRVLAVGPVAIVSLMVASALTPLATPGSVAFTELAFTLAFLCGLCSLALGLLRIGFLINFISLPVLAGFTSAAALIIGASQLSHLLGIEIARTESLPAILGTAAEKLGQINLPTLAIGGMSLVLLLGREALAEALTRYGVLGERSGSLLGKAMPLVAAALATLLSWQLQLASTWNVKIVGVIPAGLPSPVRPMLDLDTLQRLLPAALVICLVGFLESVSVAKSLASKRRQNVNANQELVALGTANLAAAFSGAYPVSGSFSRSVVNFGAGANSQLAALVTGGFIALSLIALMPLLYHLPLTVLAAIIIMAAISLLDFSGLQRAWRYSRAEGASYVVTFLAVLAIGVLEGMLVGVATSLAMHLWHTSRPHIAVVGQVGEGNVFRNVLKYKTRTYEGVLLLRVDESLYFANANYLENAVLRYVAANPKVKHVILICTSVNAIDASGLETLEILIGRLKDAGVTLHLAAVKMFLFDALDRMDFVAKLAPGRIFLSTHEAVLAILRQTDSALPDGDHS